VLATISTIGSFVGLIISLLLLAWQTRAVAQQTKISNDLAGADVLRDTTESVHRVLDVFIERPELRKYLYGRQPCPRRGPDKERVLVVAEMFADVLEGGLVTTRRTPTSESYNDWLAYCAYMLHHSPALKETVVAHLDWYPYLGAMIVGPSLSASKIPPQLP
jgi:hypothetical protein